MQLCNDNHIFARTFQKGKAGFGSYSSLNQRMRSSTAHQEPNHRNEIMLCQEVLGLFSLSEMGLTGEAGYHVEDVILV